MALCDRRRTRHLRRMNVKMLRTAGLLCTLAFSSAAFAQAVDESALDALDRQALPVVPVSAEPSGAVELRSAMRRISFSPTDADALADAGNASLILGDANAALNFFTRANALRPGNSRIVSGLAIATVRTENPFEALRLFDDAVRLGATERSIAADRALAFDLLGNFGRAQQDYNLARTASTSDDLVMRQAISLSLAGQKEQADAMLVPLLQRKNAAAWRARAFILAARGDLRESTKVAQGFMDTASAQRMERFFRLMPNLTGAQQAAAIHLGHFPTSQYVGRDSEQVRSIAATMPQTTIASSENRLIPSGEPLGPKAGKSRDTKTAQRPESKRDRKARERAEVQVAIANIPESLKLPKTDTARLGTATARAKVEEAQSSRITSANTNALPVPETARPLVRLPSPQSATQQATTPRQSAGVTTSAVGPRDQSAVAPVNTRTVLSRNASSSPMGVITPLPVLTGPPAPQTNVASNVVTTQGVSTPVVSQPQIQLQPQMAAPTPTPGPVAVRATSSGFDLGAIVGSIQIPESEQQRAEVPVDLKMLRKAAVAKPATADTAKNDKVYPKVAGKPDPKAAAKVDPKIAAKAKAEKDNPARFWVQVAAGDAGALGFDFKKFAKKYPELFKGKNGWTTPWGRTDRLLIGPFADQNAAKKWDGDFKKAGGDSFMWKSEIGVPVTQLKAK